MLLCMGVSIFAQKAQSDSLAGKVYGETLDAETGDYLSYVKIQYANSTKQYASDLFGNFQLPRRNRQQLVFSFLGFKSQTVTITEKTKMPLKIKLKPDTRMMAQVVVEGKRKKYSRKENPAVELMRRVIAKNKESDIKELYDYVKYDKYRKLTIAMNDVNPDSIKANGKRRKDWYLNQMYRCEENGKMVLPVNYEEMASEVIYRRSTNTERNIIQGQRSEGVSELFDTGQNINKIADDVFTDIDIHKNQVKMLQFPFISPIGSGAISFYRYYIRDTVMVNTDKCIKLDFVPNNPQDFGFSGTLYVLADTASLHVRRCDLSIPSKSDVNWVDNIKIKLEYEQLPSGEWVQTRDDMFCELSMLSFIPKAVAFRTTRRGNYRFDELPASDFIGMGNERIVENSAYRDSTFWNTYRTAELTKGEEHMSEYIKGLKKSSGFGVAMNVLKIVVENYFELGNQKHPSLVDFGPITTIFSQNYIDGFRVRASFATTPRLSPHFFAKAYGTYAFKSHKGYYGTELIYSINRKESTVDAYPKRKLYFMSSIDNMAPSDVFSEHDKDNMFTAFKASTNPRRIFYNRQRLGFDYEMEGGLEFTAHYNWERQDHYYIQGQWGNGANNHLTLSEFQVGLRWAPGEHTINTKQRRWKINKNNPIFEFKHTVGIKGFLGGTYNSNQSELSAYYRLYMRNLGRLTMYALGKIQWNTLKDANGNIPFMLLVQANSTYAFVGQDNKLNMMGDMEFLADRALQWNLEWDLNGFLFNRIPLLNKLKWREHVGFNGYWGTLSSKNYPKNLVCSGEHCNSNHDVDPAHMDIHNLTWAPGSHVLGSMPFMELRVGVHNIFNFFLVEYVRRLTYTDLPGVTNNGVRFKFQASF